MTAPGRVQVRDGTVVTSSGDLLRGVPVWVYRFGTKTGRTAHFRRSAYYRRLRKLGVNAIRIVCFDAWQQANGYIHYDVLDPAELSALAAEIDVIVDLAGAHGLYAMIDYHTSGACDPIRLHAFWKAIASRYAFRPHVFYELANEPVAWFPRDYTSAALELQKSTYNLVRSLAPDTHLVLFTFPNLIGEPGDPSMADIVASVPGIDWTNASVGVHPYKTGHTSQPLLALRSRFPVLNTEMNAACPAGDPFHAEPMDGHEWGVQTMETLGISWFVWDTETPAKFESKFIAGLIADAAGKGYLWKPSPTGFQSPSALESFRAHFPFRACAAVMHFSWAHSAACAALYFLSALLDAAMLATLLPFAQGMAQGNFLFLQSLPVFNVLARSGPAAAFLLLAVLILLLGVLKNASLFAANLLIARRYTTYSTHLSSWAIARFLHFGKGYFDQNGTARIGDAIDNHNHVLGLWTSALRLVASALMLAAYLGVLLLVSYRLTLALLLLAPILQIAFSWAKRRTAAAAENAKQWNRDAASSAANIYRTLPLYRAFGREAEAQKAFSSVIHNRNRATLAVWIPQELLRRFQDCAILLSLLALLAFALLLNPTHTLNMPVLLVFFYVARVALPQLTQIHDTALSAVQHVPGAMAFAALFSDSEKWIVPSGTREMPAAVQTIAVRNLTFAYPKSPIRLQDVSLTARRGELTALAGPSGAGKSTLLHLLPRFFDAPHGTIFFDDVDIRLFSLTSLRRGISLVSQDTLLLPASIRENLSFGMDRPSHDAELWDALRGVGLEPFVRSLPNGLDTRVGDGAADLSGGQRQRLSIARAICKRAPVLLLDEPSSAVDAIAEEQILDTLAALLPHSVTIVVTHRLATIERAHRVEVFNHGRIVERGTPTALLSAGGVFQRLFGPGSST
jgi:subfamily B ATP-binding cassette protein MsbA